MTSVDNSVKMEKVTKEDLPCDVFILNMVEDGNKKTEMYVKFAKVMVMCQGPYSQSRIQALGKIPKRFQYSSRSISDETYCKESHAKCTYEEAENFYSYFQYACQKALEDGNNLVILNPTMSNVKQNRFYLALAYKMQYVFLVMPPFITSSGNPEWPERSLAESFKKVEVHIPGANMFQHLFCAWYLHDSDSLALRHEAGFYVNDCLENIDTFAEIFSRVCPSEGETPEPSESKCTSSSFNKYYKLDEKRQDLAFCAVKIFTGFRSANDYFKRKEVLNYYGKMTKLIVVGFIVSPSMVAARIKLNPGQKMLWDIEDDIREDNEIQVADLTCPSELVKEIKSELPEVDVRLVASKTNPTLINTKKTIDEPTEIIQDNAKARSCHIVLGKAPGARKQNIDYDVAFALTRERNFKKNKTNVHVTELESCHVKRLGKFWFIYLKERLSVDAFLATCCKPFSYENAIK